MPSWIHFKRTPLLAVWLFLALVSFVCAQSQQAYRCNFAPNPPKIDGQGNDDCWKQAPVIDNFRMAWLNPKEQASASSVSGAGSLEKPTRAKLLWDREYLYVWAFLKDRDIQATLKERDSQTWMDDCFEMFLKPAKEHPGYYEFHVTPANTQMDLYIPERIRNAYSLYKSSAEFDFQSSVLVDGTIENRDDEDRSWQVEFKIAWKDFFRTGGAPKPDEIWSFSLCRYDYDRRSEQPTLTSTSPLTQPSFHRHEEFAELQFAGPQPSEKLFFPVVSTSRVQGSPEPPPPFTTEPVALGFEIDHPILIRSEPKSQAIWLITQKAPYGPSEVHRIASSSGYRDARVLESQTDRVHYDLCFHPEYPSKPYLFAGLNETVDGVKRSRIVRFELEVNAEVVRVIDEQVVIDWPSDGHNGAALTFGPDRMLYITSGDGTTDSDTNLRGQDLTHLTAKVLRIDIDHPAADKLYCVPSDNPFVDREHARPETWAYGLRNPWRITTDTDSGRIWLAQNGQDVWEQVYLVKRGANYGWSVMEGASLFYANREKGPDPFEPPVKDHHHSEARSLTGGIVYRGSNQALASLNGSYIYGDYSTGKIWAIDHDGTLPSAAREIADTPHAITSFERIGDGEIWIADHIGKGLVRLIPNRAQDTSKDFPRRLSETGLFASVADHKLAPGIIPYSVNSPLWSDGAYKERAFLLPNRNGSDRRIEFQNQFGWTFPNDTVLIKSFALEPTTADVGTRKWIETRLMVRQQNEWTGYTYRWNEEGTDAELVDAAGEDVPYRVKDKNAPEGFRDTLWHYPSRAECMVCHSRAANFTLGLQTSQINRPHEYGHLTANQLLVFESLGLFNVQPAMFAPATPSKLEATDSNEEVSGAMKLSQRAYPSHTSLLPTSPERLPKLVNPSDESQSIDLRVVSYLHSNCASCHVPAGGGNAAIDLNFANPITKMGILDELPKHQDFGIEGAKIVASGAPERSVLFQRIARRGNGQMPPIASNEVDAQAVELVRRWIEQLPEFRDR